MSDITNEQRISAVYGSAPVATGAGVKTLDASAYAYEVWEDTVCSAFKDADGNTVTTGWETKTISEGKTIFFPSDIKSITVTSGGLGQVYRSESL